MNTSKTFDRQTAGTLLVLGPDEIDRQAWKAAPGCSGVRVTEVWRSGDIHDALISYEPGAETPGHPHPRAHHHIWVISGSATVAGRRVLAGSYMHVPPGTAHRINQVGPAGCVLLQMHRSVQTPAQP
jgi:mannose-6-phosphate isomerase-like protein (cupin superfamily)